MKTWIVSAGAEGRDYAKDFFRFGMAFVGGKSQRETMKRVAAGDAILLKRGTTEFLAAGTIVERSGPAVGDGDKAWLNDFDGWDLGGYCYVDWHKPDQPERATGLRIGTIYETTNAEQLWQSVIGYLQVLRTPGMTNPQARLRCRMTRS